MFSEIVGMKKMHSPTRKPSSQVCDLWMINNFIEIVTVAIDSSNHKENW